MSRALMVVVLGLALLEVAAAQEITRLTKVELDAIDRAVGAELDEQAIPGASVAVGKRGQLVFQKGYGLADVENVVPVTANTRFRTASIAKPMTAVAVMQLAEAGKLDLDAPIRTYVPEWPERHATLTCRQLLCHTAGVRHYKRSGEASGTAPFFDLTSTLRLFADDDLLSKPGTEYSYTTYGFTLLGIAVERASGMSFGEYLEKRVWGPAGMTRSAVDNHFMILKDRARGYQKLDRRRWLTLPKAMRDRVKVGAVLNANLHDTSMKIPGGGLVSTAGDLCRFGLAMMGEELVRPETRRAMFTRQKLADGKEISYGLGWSVGTTNGQPRIAHGGAQAGTACYLTLFPKRGLTVAVMTNLRGADTRSIVRAVTEIVR